MDRLHLSKSWNNKGVYILIGLTFKIYFIENFF